MYMWGLLLHVYVGSVAACICWVCHCMYMWGLLLHVYVGSVDLCTVACVGSVATCCLESVPASMYVVFSHLYVEFVPVCMHGLST